MKIVLTESGGFVGVPLHYEVDVSALSATDVSALEMTMASTSANPPQSPTSAGGIRIRLETDDGNVKELNLSHTDRPSRETSDLVERLRSCAKIMPKD